LLSKSYFLLFSLLIFPILNQAAWRDPTRPGNQSFSSHQVKAGATALNLSAIWISQYNKRATINGKTVQQGQKLAHNMTVLKINSHYVLIDHAGTTKKLSLIPALSDKR